MSHIKFPTSPEKERAYRDIINRITAIGFKDITVGYQDWEFVYERGDIQIGFGTFTDKYWEITKGILVEGAVIPLVFFDNDLNNNKWSVYDRDYFKNPSSGNFVNHKTFQSALNDFISRL